MNAKVLKQAESVVAGRERAERDAEVREEAERIEADASRRAARDVLGERTRAMREAEQKLRQHEGATRVTVEMFDVKVTGYLERSGEPVARQQAAHALAESVSLFSQAFEERVGLARAAALGRPEEAGTWTADYVERRVRDACRYALASGLVTVERV